MEIIKKETLKFSNEETRAISITIDICTGLMREATDPNLKKAAEEAYYGITTLWGWEG